MTTEQTRPPYQVIFDQDTYSDLVGYFASLDEAKQAAKDFAVEWLYQPGSRYGGSVSCEVFELNPETGEYDETGEGHTEVQGWCDDQGALHFEDGETPYLLCGNCGREWPVADRTEAEALRHEFACEGGHWVSTEAEDEAYP